MPAKITCPAEIEKTSFDIVRSLIEQGGYTVNEFQVVTRVVHATADTEFAKTMVFSEGAVEAGIAAVRRGCNIITDVKMLMAGISPDRPGGGDVTRCFISDPDVAADAKKGGATRAVAAMRKAAPMMEGCIVAVGNAPTALFELIELIKAGKANPALVVGVPVGFVGAAESKEALIEELKDTPYITCRGRKGGSPVGASVLNAIIKLVNNG
jgi:precorrin-8X/cobalt-precorrin-8 methylmutase